MPTHITIGANADFDKYLDRNVGRGPAGNWPVVKNARPGERVVLLVPALHGPLRAYGTIAGSPQLGSWGDSPRYFVPVENLKRLEPPVPLELLRNTFPEWKWTGYARSFTTVPSELDARFWRLLNTPPIGCDIEPPSPDRVSAHVSRIVRDTATAYALKAQYDFECQLCGTALEYAPGAYYVEVHHLRPLGRPHDGPDARDNMLVLCPNHHALFDLGVPVFVAAGRVLLNGQSYSLTQRHHVSSEHIAYYSNHCQRGGAA